MGSGPSRGRQQEGSLKRSKEDSLREQEPVPGGSMERREVTGTTDDHDMTDRSPRGQAAKRPRPAPDPASHPPGASAFRVSVSLLAPGSSRSLAGHQRWCIAFTRTADTLLRWHVP